MIARRNVLAWLAVVAASLGATAAWAVAFLPISDAALRARADAIVQGIVLSTRVAPDAEGRPENVIVIRPLDVIKGRVGGELVLHQLGGRLPDGRAFDLPGSPRYTPGAEVLVFAIARPEGDYQTAEMLLGKFEVARDGAGRLFAVPALAGSDAPRAREYHVVPKALGAAAGVDFGPPRELAAFKKFLRRPFARSFPNAAPAGTLAPVRDASIAAKSELKWALLGGPWRWNNGAVAAWVTDGTVNITGGGTAEATKAVAAWTNDPNSQITYTLTTDASANPMHLAAPNSPCGWSSCLDGAGVVGCGGPNGGGTHSWRGETYNTILGGTVWLRPYCKANMLSSAATQSVLEHELGHTLGLDHSDQGMISPHDLCVGDESAAVMTAVSTGLTALGTDDLDAVRWLYGDGGNSCGGGAGTLTLSPTSLDFGDAQTGATSKAKSITLDNPGNAPVGITSIVASGDFTSTDNCASSVAVFGSCTVSVTFKPTQAGSRQGTLTVHTSSAGDFQASLSGYGEKPMPAAAGAILVPVVAQTGSFTAETYVHNGNATAIALNVTFYEADGAAAPGAHACSVFTVPANSARLLSLGSVCALGAGSHFGMLALQETTGTKAFTAFARTQTPAGVGFTVDGRPMSQWGPGPAFVDGLRRTSAGAKFQSNCYAAALGSSLGYRIDLTTGDGAALGAPIFGSLSPYEMVRYLDVFQAAAAPAGEYSEVRAKFTQTSPGGAPLVGFCTVQESVTFSADFRNAKPDDGAAPTIVVPLVASTGSFASELYVRNPGAGALTVNVTLDEAGTSSKPGVHACAQLAIPANATRLLSLVPQCGLDSTPHFGTLVLEDASVPRTRPFNVYSRTQTPAGVGFSVEGFPVASFDGTTRFVAGLRRTGAPPSYQSNCFIGALDASVAYTLQLLSKDNVPIGAPLSGTLAPHGVVRYLDVFASANAPAGDYAEVMARFSVAGGASFDAYCTMQESITFGADFRLAN